MSDIITLNEYFSWNSQDATQHSIPFQLKIKLPTPRKFREIIALDSRGKSVAYL